MNPDPLSSNQHSSEPTDAEVEQLRGDIQAELMEMREELENDDMRRLALFIYLIPVIGFMPALWTLYRRLGDRHQQSASRLSVTLAMGWLLGHLLLNLGASTSPNLTLPLLLMSSLLTSGYFLTNLWLMAQLLRRKRLWLPGLSRLSDRLP